MCIVSLSSSRGRGLGRGGPRAWPWVLAESGPVKAGDDDRLHGDEFENDRNLPDTAHRNAVFSFRDPVATHRYQADRLFAESAICGPADSRDVVDCTIRVHGKLNPYRPHYIFIDGFVGIAQPFV